MNFWIEEKELPTITGIALNILQQFCIMYFCEVVFAALTIMKSTYQSTPQTFADALCLALPVLRWHLVPQVKLSRRTHVYQYTIAFIANAQKKGFVLFWFSLLWFSEAGSCTPADLDLAKDSSEFLIPLPPPTSAGYIGMHQHTWLQRTVLKLISSD